MAQALEARTRYVAAMKVENCGDPVLVREIGVLTLSLARLAKMLEPPKEPRPARSVSRFAERRAAHVAYYERDREAPARSRPAREEVFFDEEELTREFHARRAAERRGASLREEAGDFYPEPPRAPHPRAEADEAAREAVRSGRGRPFSPEEMARLEARREEGRREILREEAERAAREQARCDDLSRGETSASLSTTAPIIAAEAGDERVLEQSVADQRHDGLQRERSAPGGTPSEQGVVAQGEDRTAVGGAPALAGPEPVIDDGASGASDAMKAPPFSPP
jgi:hypothetical protein